MKSRRRKKQISAACHYAYTRLALNYYMYYEVILEGDLLSSRLERLSKRYHGLLKDFLEGSLELEELNGLRDDTAWLWRPIPLIRMFFRRMSTF